MLMAECVHGKMLELALGQDKCVDNEFLECATHPMCSGAFVLALLQVESCLLVSLMFWSDSAVGGDMIMVE